MRYFDFTGAYVAAYAAAKTEPEKWTVQTRVGAEQFPAALKRAGIIQLHESSEKLIGSAPHVLVVGVATWSHPDLAILDDIVAITRTRDVLLLVFDIDDCRDMEDIHRFIPDADFVSHTPVIAQYREG